MIAEQTVDWCKLTDTAVQELLLLISLTDLKGRGTARDILSNITRKGYFQRPITQLTYTLEHHLPTAGLVQKDALTYRATKRSKIRLRDLCELTNAMPSRATILSTEGFNRLRELRKSLTIYPFTNGARIEDGPRVRQTHGYRVYAILLHEFAYSALYQSLNPQHDRCLPCVYVGMTGQTPLQRFDQHRFGEPYLRSTFVNSYGLCLMPLLYAPFNQHQMTKAQAAQTEKQFADCLREQGFAAFAGHLDKPKRWR